MDEQAVNTENPRHRHETRDASIPAIVKFAVGLFLSIAASMVVARLVFNYFAAHQSLGPPASPFENTRELPPAGVPRLQVEAPQELHQYLKQENEVLHSYGWVDQKNGIVRIPINRAMDLLIQRGLPVQSAPPQGEVLQPGSVPQYTVPKGYTPAN
jgi:hypothetical protein